jgi:hypothetical protein
VVSGVAGQFWRWCGAQQYRLAEYRRCAEELLRYRKKSVVWAEREASKKKMGKRKGRTQQVPEPSEKLAETSK